jgi:thioredoxin-like negative regulator of GroEL
MEQQLLKAVEIVENQVDAELEKLDNLDDNEIERLRNNRLEAMKKAHNQKLEWQKAGHGTYTELKDEKEFFEACKSSKHVICHFYRDSTFRCKIVDKHLDLLTRSHMECKFVKINAEKSPFLTERLKIRVIPTIALIRDNKPVDYVVGFGDLGNVDDFETEMLEWRIARTGIIEYAGDLLNPPDSNSRRAAKKANLHAKSKIIRGNNNQSDSDDNDNNND